MFSNFKKEFKRSLISGFGGRCLGCKGANIFSVTCILVTNLLAFFIFYEIGFSDTFATLRAAEFGLFGFVV